MKLVILLGISLVLMVWNYRHPGPARKWREALSFTTIPVVTITNAPFVLSENIVKRFQSQESLLNENNALRAQVLVLAGQLQKFKALQAENQALRVLLQSSPVTHQLKLLLAQVMSVQTSPYGQEILLNKGSNDNVFVGQAVLDAWGVMGQVIEVAPYTARVLLLTDSRSGIPVQDGRTGLRGILKGQGGTNVLRWVNIPLTADVRVGDVLVTSGLGGRYPVGDPVAEVTKVNFHTSDQFLGVEAVSRAHLNSSALVLLVWADKKKVTS